MIVKFANQTYDCEKAVRDGDRAKLYFTDGGTVEFVGVSDTGWNQFQLEGGNWETTEPTELERLRADVDYLSVMTGVVL